MNTEKLKHLPDFINTKLGSGAKILTSKDDGRAEIMKENQQKLKDESMWIATDNCDICGEFDCNQDHQEPAFDYSDADVYDFGYDGDAL